MPLLVCIATSLLALAFLCHRCRAKRRVRRAERLRAEAEHKRAALAEEAVGAYATDAYQWDDFVLSGLPLSSHAEGTRLVECYNHRSLLDSAPLLDSKAMLSIGLPPDRFASPPLAVLATGEARVATHNSHKCCFMLHSVELAVTAHAANRVMQEVAELRKIKHPNILSILAAVADQPCGQMGLLSELAEGSLATLLDKAPVRLTWSNGLLAIATDVAAGLAHLHWLGLHHGRLFLFNVVVDAEWRAKLAEYALDPYLASHDEVGAAGGEHNLLPSSHDERGAQLPAALFLSPERCTRGKRSDVQRGVATSHSEPGLGHHGSGGFMIAEEKESVASIRGGIHSMRGGIHRAFFSARRMPPPNDSLAAREAGLNNVSRLTAAPQWPWPFWRH